jgi:hypothetical protein
MNLDTLQAFFGDPPPSDLNTSLAVGFVLSVLLEQDTDSTEFKQQLEQKYPAYRLSHPVLYQALAFLEAEGAVLSYWQRSESHAPPRRLFNLAPHMRKQAGRLATLWRTYMQCHPSPGGLSYSRSRGSGSGL